MNQINSWEDYIKSYQHSIDNPIDFWNNIAKDFYWFKPYTNTLQWNFSEPQIQWFLEGQTNICYNCIDRHLIDKGDQTAILFEPNNPNEPTRSYTYKQLYHEVNRLAHVMQSFGIEKGDRVCIYMPMIPEGTIAMLACARLGAVHTVVFAGFSANSLADRINDCDCKLIITADAVYRGAKKIILKEIVDEALVNCPSIEKCIIYNHRNEPIQFNSTIDCWWHEHVPFASDEFQAIPVDSEHPLFILYTSGSTGKPKGVLHTTAGYMIYAAYTFLNVFNYKPNEIFWCTADIGWVTGHSYLVYGPLLTGATTLIFEGIPNYPDYGRFWEIVDKHQVNILYTAPTAIRALEAAGVSWFEGKNLKSLRVLGSVGEPINEDAWNWYYTNVGKKNCPIVDTWWQTETGGILISPISHVTPMKPAFASFPLPGIQPVLVDSEGKEIEGNGVEGNLCIKFPWPGMSRSLYGNHERFRQTYFSTYKNYYFTGDGAKRDEEGYYRITGRVDDVINVSGHRIGTGEVEDAINSLESVVESAVVGFPHEIKGQGIYAYIILINQEENIENHIRESVSKIIGSFAKPDKILIVPGLPKTRSGKIMRRFLRKIAEGEYLNLGDTTTLLDPNIIEQIIQLAKHQ